MPDRDQLLTTYLSDHLVASSAGRDLFRRAAKSHRDTPRGPQLQRLAREVDEDRDAQLDVMRALGIEPSLLRVTVGRAAEWLGRLKPNGTLVRRSPLSDVVELEAMRAGVEAKVAGWEALLAVADRDPRVSRPRLEELLARAHDQAQRLQTLHQQAAADAFG
jgi:hypothetical protein